MFVICKGKKKKNSKSDFGHTDPPGQQKKNFFTANILLASHIPVLDTVFFWPDLSPHIHT